MIIISLNVRIVNVFVFENENMCQLFFVFSVSQDFSDLTIECFVKPLHRLPSFVLFFFAAAATDVVVFLIIA